MSLGTGTLGTLPLGGGSAAAAGGGGGTSDSGEYEKHRYEKVRYLGDPSPPPQSAVGSAIAVATATATAVRAGVGVSTATGVATATATAYAGTMTPATGEAGFYGYAVAEVDVDVESPPANLTTRSLLRVSPAMRQPIFADGRPIHPTVVFNGTGTFGVTASTFAPSGVEAVTDPEAPEAGVTATYRWESSSLVGSVGSHITSWASTVGSLNWTASAPTRPKVVGYEDVRYGVSYDSVVFHWSRYSEQMDLSLSWSQPYTIIMVVAISSPTAHHTFLGGNHVLKASAGVSTIAAPTEVDGGMTLRSVPQVVTGVFDGANSRMRIRDAIRTQQFTGDPGSAGFSDLQIAGDTGGTWAKYYLDILMYENQALTESQIKTVEDSLFTRYELNKFA